jgi:predicted helicase
MATDHRAELARIQRFDQLVRYLRDEMGWPIAIDDFEELTFDYSAEELGINAENAAKIQDIKRLRPLSAKQPWGIFFVKFEPKSLPVVALRRVLSQVAIKKRASANAADRAGWEADDLLFVSNYGQGGARQISFAHFSRPSSRQDLPTLKVLGWDNQDTPLHLDAIAKELTENLAWPQDEDDVEEWRRRWRGAFTLGHREVITTAERLSIRLAELAGSIRDRIRSAIAIESSRGPLTRLMKAFQESLVNDLDAEGFADMYAQTISYGLLSSRIADPSKKTADDFAAHMRTSPFLRELMQTFLKVGGRQAKVDGAGIDFDELGVADVVELLDGANMEAVLRDFGDRNRQEDPVIHFFEGFLQAYDKKIRKDRGVFYTPQPVVSYIVRSVHELLQSEFGLEDGLASTITWGEMLKRHPGHKLPPLTDDPNEMRTISPNEPFVQILDPATGTATFPVEVIDVIYRTLAAKWKLQGLTFAQQLSAWNDYVPKHLLPRLHAYELMMAPYAIAHMKIGLKLAETGYQFGTEERARIYLTNALEPWVRQLPLIGFEALAQEATAVNEIKRHKRFTVVIGNPPYAGHSANKGRWIEGLVDDYFQINGTPLNEANSKWLRDDYVKFMRLGQEIMRKSGWGLFSFITNHGYIDNPTFRGLRFSLLSDFRRLWVTDLHGNMKKKERDDVGGHDENVFDIQQGVAVFAALFGHTSTAQVWHGHVRGNRSVKYARLAKESSSGLASTQTHPSQPFYLLMPQNISARSEYDGFFVIAQDAQECSLGILTKRDSLVVAFSTDELLSALRRFADPCRSDKEVAEEFGVPLADKDKWNVSKARASLAGVSERNVRPLLYRPFDIRFVYYEDTLVARTNRRVLKHLEQAKGNWAFIFGRQGMATGSEQWDVCFACSGLADQNIYRRGGGTVFPIHLASDEHGLDLGDSRLNFSGNLTKHFTGFKAKPEDIFHYAYAVFHSPSYRSRYAEFLKIDFPRLPLTSNLELFCSLARLGGELTALHLMESPRLVQTITEFIGSRNISVEKLSWSRDTVWVDKAQTTGFRGVREPVWNFHIGGYKVCEKWLKDRKGRTLSKDDIAHYQKVVVALSETMRVMSEIDVVIEQHGGWPGAFQSKAE